MSLLLFATSEDVMFCFVLFFLAIWSSVKFLVGPWENERAVFSSSPTLLRKAALLMERTVHGCTRRSRVLGDGCRVADVTVV